jgi:hypothetical protein
MAKIVINIDMDELTSGINQVVDDDMYEMEEEFVCPLSTQDSEKNAENREHAIQEYAYGHSVKTGKKRSKSAETVNTIAYVPTCLIALRMALEWMRATRLGIAPS